MLKYFVKTFFLIPEANKTCKVLVVNKIKIYYRKLGKLIGYKFEFEKSSPHKEGNQIDLCRYLYVKWQYFVTVAFAKDILKYRVIVL